MEIQFIYLRFFADQLTSRNGDKDHIEMNSVRDKFARTKALHYGTYGRSQVPRTAFLHRRGYVLDCGDPTTCATEHQNQ